ncbi:MAG TPA: ATP-binding protein [Gemmatimonadaceae bacterium]|nr:ATP-binding protein [Gemmatimonadaceae bacterium]
MSRHRASAVTPDPLQALAALSDLASALFPSGIGELRQLTWEATTTPPEVPRRLATPGGGLPDREEVRLRAAELRYRTLVEQIPAVTFMAMLGEGENEIYVSPHIEALLGFSQKEWLENPILWYTQVHPDDRATWVEEFARGVRTGGPFQAECRLIARDGRIIWVRGEARLIKDELGRPLFLQGVAFDITDSRNKQERVVHQAVQRTEERYRDLVERLGAIFWEAEAETGRFTFVSRGAERILGFPHERWLEESMFWNRVHPEDRERTIADWRSALAGDGTQEFEFRAIAADDRIVWLQNRVHAGGLDRVNAHALGVIIDITERKQAEEELARTLVNEQLARVEAEALNRVGRSVGAELDIDQLVRQVVDAGVDLTGAEWAAFCRVSEGSTSCEAYVRHGAASDAVDRAVVPIEDPLLRQTFAGATMLAEGDHQEPLDLFDGADLRSYLGVPVRSRSGGVIGGLIFGHALPGRFTARHARIIQVFAAQAAIAVDNAQLYNAAQSARKTAEMASRVKDEFLATMSHELRTPINALLGWANVLELQPDDRNTRERAVAAIQRNARAQAQMVEDLLDVSRIVTGKLQLQTTRVDLASVIDAALEMVKLAADAKHTRVVTTLARPSVTVLGDAGRLRQILSNLLTNAVKFTPEGGRIEVRLTVDDSVARIQVSDTGQGMPREFLPHAFERFRQADSSSTRNHGGLGLGLAIVRHLTELHGGRVSADSPGVGQGATFTVELPLYDGHEAPGLAAANAETQAANADDRGARVLSPVARGARGDRSRGSRI